MKASTTNELKGKMHAVKGTVKETAGQIINRGDIEAEGRNERVAGKVQEKIGQVEKVLEK